MYHKSLRGSFQGPSGLSRSEPEVVEPRGSPAAAAPRGLRGGEDQVVLRDPDAKLHMGRHGIVTKMVLTCTPQCTSVLVGFSAILDGSG